MYIHVLNYINCILKIINAKEKNEAHKEIRIAKGWTDL